MIIFRTLLFLFIMYHVYHEAGIYTVAAFFLIFVSGEIGHVRKSKEKELIEKENLFIKKLDERLKSQEDDNKDSQQP